MDPKGLVILCGFQEDSNIALWVDMLDCKIVYLVVEPPIWKILHSQIESSPQVTITNIWSFTTQFTSFESNCRKKKGDDSLDQNSTPNGAGC